MVFFLNIFFCSYEHFLFRTDRVRALGHAINSVCSILVFFWCCNFSTQLEKLSSEISILISSLTSSSKISSLILTFDGDTLSSLVSVSAGFVKVAFSQKGLMRSSFLQTDKPNYFPELDFWFFLFHSKWLKSCQIRTWSCSNAFLSIQSSFISLFEMIWAI